MIRKKLIRPEPPKLKNAVSFEKEDSHGGRTSTNRDIYGSNDWKKLSVSFRKRNPWCAACFTKGRYSPGTQVDHIVPINDGGDPWDEDNLQSLCKSCHERKSARERHNKK